MYYSIPLNNIVLLEILPIIRKPVPKDILNPVQDFYMESRNDRKKHKVFLSL